MTFLVFVSRISTSDMTLYLLWVSGSILIHMSRTASSGVSPLPSMVMFGNIRRRGPRELGFSFSSDPSAATCFNNPEPGDCADWRIENLVESARPPLDFDVVKEIWDRYELADNTILKVKAVLTAVRKADPSKESEQNAKGGYTMDFQNIIVMLTNERGLPDPRAYSPQELQAAIVKEDIHYTTISQEWNEYITDDGAKIRLQPLLIRVNKTSKFDAKGQPVYTTEMNLNIDVKPPGSSRFSLTR